MSAVAAVVFDLDGVVRRWDEERFAEPEDVRAVRFEAGLAHRVVTGAITDEEWRDEVARRVTEAGGDGAAATRDWYATCGRVDADVTAVVAEVRAAGCRTALLTNATTRLRSDLALLGLDGDRHFDEVFNSAELGVAKPDAEVFRIVCERLAVEAGACVFIDDTPGHVDAARRFGLRAHVYEGVDALRDVLAREGVL